MKERKQAIFSIRMDSETKREFDSICNQMGITSAAAFNMFAKQVVLEGGLPFRPTTRLGPEKKGLAEAFEALRKDAEKNGTIGMSMDEINAEIDLYRKGK